MIKCVLFDLDGTLLDDEEFTISSKIIEGKKFGYDVKEEDVKKTLGLSTENSSKFFKSIYGEDFPVEYLKGKRTEYIINFFKKNGLRLKPYVNEFLSFLKENDYKICICTSTPKKCIEEYRKYGDLFDKFDHIVTGDMVQNGKPSPDIFLLGAKICGYSIDECLVIEDSNTGVEAALNAKIDVIMIPDLVKPLEKYLGCVKIYKDMSQVIEYLREKGVENGNFKY